MDTALLKQAHTEADYRLCWEVMQHLRPHLTYETFRELLAEMPSEKYHLWFLEVEGSAVSVVGFRYMTQLYAGRIMYIDDLVTRPDTRGKGYGGMLLEYVLAEAKAQHLNAVHLDSGHQRFDAHRLYVNKGFQIRCHHFEHILDYTS